MAELGVQPPTGLYPQPPAPPSQGALSDPTKMLDLFGSVMKNQILQNELKGRAAVGQAALGAYGPNGFDVNAFNSNIQKNPDAAWYALEAGQKGQDLARTQFDRKAAQEQVIRQLGGSMPENPTNEDLYNMITSAVRGGVPPSDAMELLNTFTNSRNRRAIPSLMRNFGLSPAEQSQRPDVEPGAGGARQTAPLTDVNRRGAIATTLPAYAGASIEAMQKGQASFRNFATDVEPIRQALDKINELKAKYGAGFLGPGNDSRQVVESYLYGASPKLATLLGVDPEKLKNYDELKKDLANVTMARATAYGAHSDQQLTAAASGSPNVNMTDLAVPELLKIQYALKKAEYAQHQQAVARGGLAGEEYLNESSAWPSRNDPRAFMMPMLSREEQDKVIASLPKGSPERQRFNNAMRAGYETGMIDRPGRPTVAPPTASVPTKPLPKPGKQSQAAPPAPPPAPAKSDRATYPRWEYDQDNVPGKQSQAEPPVPGARQAADGHWYVRQPHANGDYQRVIMNA